MLNQKSNTFKNFIVAIKYISEDNLIYIIISILNAFFSSILPVVSLLILQSVLNMIQANSFDIKKAFYLVGIYILIDIFQLLIQGLINYYQNKFSLKFNLKIKILILDHASKLKLKDYEDSNTYDIIQRAQYQNEGKILSYFLLFIQLMGTLIKAISYCLILITLKIWIIGIVVSIPMIRFIFRNRFNKKEVEILRSRTEQDRKVLYWSQIITNGINYKEIKLYDLFDYFIHCYANIIKVFNRQDLKLFKELESQTILFGLIDSIINGGLFAYIIFQGFIKTILIGEVLTFTRAIIEAKNAIKSILDLGAQIQKESLYLDQLFEFFSLKPKQYENSNSQQFKIDSINEIRLEALSYKYRNDDKYVLKNINLKICRGELCAILGENGSGKTTLIKIIMGFYEDYEGNIFVNGINLHNINRKSYMSKIGALFQDFSRYEATLRENISYGNKELMCDDNKLLEISKKFGLTDLITCDSRGLDMQLGFWFDNGKQLSTGQWQKVALSRAFTKTADMYFLDEPNAALDAISEHNLAEMYYDLLDNRVGFIVAHRFHHFIKQAKKIIVLKEGTLVEEGDHYSLLAQRRLYYTMYSLQVAPEKELLN